MNAEQVPIWQRIERAPLVSAAEDELFTRKLALQNGWTRALAQRCVLEYRKFAFLAVTCGHPVSPPDAVDQVWHLHLTYTVPYWKTFCPEVLGKPLHHSPSKGGSAEVQKFSDWYKHTLESYRSCFGEEPRDIWPDATRKCHEDRQTHRRVDTGRYWIVPKPVWLAAPLRFTMGALMMLFLMGCASLSTPSANWNVDGPAFLSIYMALLGGAVLVGASVRRAVRGPLPDGRIRPELSCYEMAFLAGGARRVLQAIVVRLYEAGAVTLDDKGKVVRTGELREVLDPMEADVRQSVEISEKNWDQLREAAGSRLNAIQNRLESLGLLVLSADAWRARAVAGLVMGIIMSVGVLRIWHGFASERPIGFLAFLVAVALGVMIWLVQRPFRTRQGDAVFENLQAAHGHNRGHTLLRAGDGLGLVAGAQLALAVGLMGVSALQGTPLEKLQSKLGPEAGGGCGGGCGGSCGGGGCGGCGGCGG